MMLIDGKLQNDVVVKIFEDISKQVIASVNNDQEHREIISLFINKDASSIKDSDIEEFIKELITSELNDLKNNEGFYIYYYVETIYHYEGIKKSMRNKRTLHQEAIQKIEELIIIINESSNYKENFFPCLTDDELNNLNSIDKYKEFITRNFGKHSHFGYIKKNLLKMFNYAKDIRTVRESIIDNMEIKVCPYCNFHVTIPKETDIDHFLPKAKFPLFGLSYGNFVPACKACNSNVRKGASTSRIINPRAAGFGSNTVFDMDIESENVVDIYLENNHNKLSREKRESMSIHFVQSDIDQEMENQINNSIVLFGLEDKFNSSSAIRIAFKSLNNIKQRESDLYEELLNNLVGKIYKTVEGYFIDEIDDDEFIVDYLNYPYSKLQFDIFEQYSSKFKKDSGTL